MSESRLRRFCLLLLGLVMALSPPRPAHACDAPIFCSDDPDRRFEEAHAVFRGRVLSFHDDDWPRFLQPVAELLGSGIYADFEVIEAWKGVETRTVRVHANRSSCGVGMWKLEPGAELLVLAKNPDGRLLATICTGPIPLDDELAQAILARVGPGARYLPPNFGHVLVRFGWFPVLFVLPVGWWWAHRRRRAQALLDT